MRIKFHLPWTSCRMQSSCGILTSSLRKFIFINTGALSPKDTQYIELNIHFEEAQTIWFQTKYDSSHHVKT